MTTVLTTSFGRFTVRVDDDGLPEYGDVLRAIHDGWPVEVVTELGGGTLHLTPAAILTVRHK